MKCTVSLMAILGSLMGFLIGPLSPLRAFSVLVVACLFYVVGVCAGMYEGDK